MAQERITSAGATALKTCPCCGQPFVLPVALLDIVDEGLYLVALHCRNCERLAVGVVEDADMEALDHDLRRDVAEMEADAEVLEISRFIEELDGFARALHADLVLPEDF
jgi:hypothetical protein